MTAAFATDFRIGVREDDERRVAAQFQAEPLHLVGGLRISCLPTSVEPVKLIFRTLGFSRNSSAISSRSR